VAIEVNRGRGEGIDNDGTRAECAAAASAARERIDEQVPAKRFSLLGAVKGEAGKRHDGNRVRHSTA